MVDMSLDAKASPEEVLRVMNAAAMNDFEGNAHTSLAVVEAAMKSTNTAIALCRIGETPAGFISVTWLNPICVKLSFGFLPAARGAIAKHFLNVVLHSLFQTSICKVVGEVMVWNKACLLLIKQMGAKQEGVNRSSVLYKGHPVDSLYFGLTQKEWSTANETAVRKFAKGGAGAECQ